MSVDGSSLFEQLCYVHATSLWQGGEVESVVEVCAVNLAGESVQSFRARGESSWSYWIPGIAQQLGTCAAYVELVHADRILHPESQLRDVDRGAAEIKVYVHVRSAGIWYAKFLLGACFDAWCPNQWRWLR
jgi:hypothetical protein